jgi:hypothetical protein
MSRHKKPEECAGGLEEYLGGRGFTLHGHRPNEESRGLGFQDSNYYEETEYIGKYIPKGTSIFVFENFNSVGYRTTTHDIELKKDMVWNHNESIVYVVWSSKNIEIAFNVLRCSIK